LGLGAAALRDIDQVMQDLPAEQRQGEAAALKERIEALCKQQHPGAAASPAREDAPKKPADPPKPADGFRRMQVVEVDDDDDEDDEVPPAAATGSTAARSASAARARGR